MRKAETAKASRQSRPELWLTLILNYPHTTQENCRSLFIFVHFGCTPIYSKSLPNPLPSSCHYILPVAFWALASSCNFQWRPRGGGLGSGALLGCVDSVRTNSHFYLVYRQFEECSHSPSLANVRTDGFNFFPSPPSLGSLSPLYIPQPFSLRTSCGRFGLS